MKNAENWAKKNIPWDCHGMFNITGGWGAPLDEQQPNLYVKTLLNISVFTGLLFVRLRIRHAHLMVLWRIPPHRHVKIKTAHYGAV